MNDALKGAELQRDLLRAIRRSAQRRVWRRCDRRSSPRCLGVDADKQASGALASSAWELVRADLDRVAF